MTSTKQIYVARTIAEPNFLNQEKSKSKDDLGELPKYIDVCQEASTSDQDQNTQTNEPEIVDV